MIYRTHSTLTFPLKQEVEEIVNSSESISSHVFYSVDDAGENISKEYSADTLDKVIEDKTSLFYICGPEKFSLDTTNILTSLGVSLDLIKIGHFGPKAS